MGSWNTGNTPTTLCLFLPLKLMAVGLLCSECSFLEGSHSLLHL